MDSQRRTKTGWTILGGSRLILRARPPFGEFGGILAGFRWTGKMEENEWASKVGGRRI